MTSASLSLEPLDYFHAVCVAGCGEERLWIDVRPDLDVLDKGGADEGSEEVSLLEKQKRRNPEGFRRSHLTGVYDLGLFATHATRNEAEPGAQQQQARRLWNRFLTAAAAAVAAGNIGFGECRSDWNDTWERLAIGSR